MLKGIDFMSFPPCCTCPPIQSTNGMKAGINTDCFHQGAWGIGVRWATANSSAASRAPRINPKTNPISRSVPESPALESNPAITPP
ncbi:MAG: hypothetical protein MUF20_08735, partial [Methylotetracoccus sp.]|nr:hypothetical protein [Methylotetracoccus sp.]